MDRRAKNRVSTTVNTQLNQPKADELTKPEWHPFQVWKTHVMRPGTEAAAEDQDVEVMAEMERASSF